MFTFYMLSTTQQTQHICMTFIQRRPNVSDVGPTLYEVIQMSCVYWEGTIQSPRHRQDITIRPRRIPDIILSHAEESRTVTDYKSTP